MTNIKRKRPSVAVIGAGYWGGNLVRIFHQIGALSLVCEKNADLIEQLGKKYPDIDLCMSFEDIKKRDDIDGVVIATPTETHYDIAREFLLSGKHVYVEKPLALDIAHGEELVEISEQKNMILMVGHILQYHPVFIKLKELVVSGELGRINYIYSHRLNLGKIRREENILWSFAPHDISMILSLAGEPPESIFAIGGYYLHDKIADVTTTHLEFSSGLKAHIFVSWLHPYKVQRLVIVGEEKMAVFDDTLPWGQKLLLYPHRINWKDNFPIPVKAEPEIVNVTEYEPLRSECEHFLSSIENGTKPITDGKEGLTVLEVLKASQNSLDSGSRKIYLDKLCRSKNTIVDNNSYFIHESSIVDSDCKIGEGTKIWHFSHILSGSRIGKNCNIGQNVVIGPQSAIGDGCKIQNNVSVYKGVTLEDYVFCGPSMVFTNVYNPRAGMSKMKQMKTTLVKKGATLGANSTIICGNTIGSYAFIGAGAVITKDVMDYALMAGNPARQIGWVCQCGEKLQDNLECNICWKRYAKTGNCIVPIS